MGHTNLGTLPKTKFWNDVVAGLDSSEPDEEVVARTARAAETSLLNAAGDPVFVEAVRLLLAIPAAARHADFGEALRAAELRVGSSPELFEIIAASMARLDDVARGKRQSTDLGQLAARALAKTLNDAVAPYLPSLFGSTPSDVQASIRRLSYSKGISALARAYFGALVSGALSYWLDRALAPRIGGGGRFASVADRSSFDVALQQYTTETTRIIQEFTGGWYGKTLFEKRQFSSRDAAEFGAVALKKIVAELQQRRPPDV